MHLCTSSWALVLLSSASARCHRTRDLSNRKGQGSEEQLSRIPLLKSWVCLLLFGIKFLLLAPLQEQTTRIKFFPTSKNICSFSMFSRLPSPWRYHKASLFSKAAFLIAHHHHLLVRCKAQNHRVLQSFQSFQLKARHCIQASWFRERVVKLLHCLFFNLLQLPVLGGNQTALRNASCC